MAPYCNISKSNVSIVAFIFDLPGKERAPRCHLPCFPSKNPVVGMAPASGNIFHCTVPLDMSKLALSTEKHIPRLGSRVVDHCDCNFSHPCYCL